MVKVRQPNEKPLATSGGVRKVVSIDFTSGTPENKITGETEPLAGGTKPPQPAVFRDSRTGGTSGVNLPSGKTFLGLGPDEVQKLIDQENKKRLTPPGSLEISGVAQQGAIDRTLIDLQTKQQAETQALEARFPQQTGPGLDTVERLAASGLIPLNMAQKWIENNLGIKDAGGTTVEELIKKGGFAGTIAKYSSAGLGKLLTLGIGGINLANKAGLGAEIPGIEKDINLIVNDGKNILSEMKSGGSIIGAIESYNTMEEAINWKIGDLQVAIAQSPKDIQEGKSADEFARRNLRLIQKYRHIAEQAAITGDLTGIDKELIAISLQNEEQNI